jgi:hypothetical protein
MRFDRRFEEVEVRATNVTKQTTIAKALRAAKSAGLDVSEFRVDPQTGVVEVLVARLPAELPRLAD